MYSLSNTLQYYWVSCFYSEPTRLITPCTPLNKAAINKAEPTPLLVASSLKKRHLRLNTLQMIPVHLPQTLPVPSTLFSSKKPHNTLSHPFPWFYLYWLLRHAATNHHKHGALKQQKFIISQFWKPSPKSRCQGTSSDGLRENPILLLPFQGLLVYLGLGQQNSSLCLQLYMTFSHPHLPDSDFPLFSLLWTAVIGFRTHPKISMLPPRDLWFSYICKEPISK